MLLVPKGNVHSTGRLVSWKAGIMSVVKTGGYRPGADPLLILPVASVEELINLVVVGKQGASHHAHARFTSHPTHP